MKDEIDEILETYATYIYSEAPDFYVPAGIKYDGINKKEAKKRLLTLLEEEKKITGDTSDGYHTFNELYDFRKVFNAVLFNEWAEQGKYKVHKSKKHSDGELCFGGGWFIVVAELPTGQISNHYELEDWDLFQIQETPVAHAFDGHTPQDVLDRLQALKQESKK